MPKETTDIIGWIVGGLGALGLFNYRTRILSDNEKFKTLFDAQRVSESKAAAMEAELKGISAHFMQTLEDIKIQNVKIGDDITKIKVSIAGIPKRQDDK